MRVFRWGFLSALLALTCAAGCGGPSLVPVTGRVVSGGKGLTAGSVWFHPGEGNAWAGEKPSCQLGLDGEFTMRTYPHGTGVPPGVYKVTLSPDLAGRIGRPNLGDPAKTTLDVTVPAGGLKNHVIEIK